MTEPHNIHSETLLSPISIFDISPKAKDGNYPAKAAVSEEIELRAKIFTDGHSLLEAQVITEINDKITKKPLTYKNPGKDLMCAKHVFTEVGQATFYFEAWVNPFKTSIKESLIKIQNNQDENLIRLESIKLYNTIKELYGSANDSETESKDAEGQVDGQVENQAEGTAENQNEIPLDKHAEEDNQKTREFFPKEENPEYRVSSDKNTIIDEVELSKDDEEKINNYISVLQNKELPIATAYENAVCNKEALAVIDKYPLKERFTVSPKNQIRVSRNLSLFTAWYQFFPRSEGAYKPKKGDIVPGNFKTATCRLNDIKNMGFDVIYIPPIHPIGVSFRKGKNNSTVAEPGDVGCPWAIGSKDGGHFSIDPNLGTMEDFENFVKAVKAAGMELSIDFALQTSPDHPWVNEHPEWYSERADGTIAYAENPPKKYQDIYPINFYNDSDGIVNESIEILKFWYEKGIKIFRVDNPHTKPVWFWKTVIERMKAIDPDIMFLAEAFTRPPMVLALGYAGFDQSHCYFPWRNEKREIEDYIEEISSDFGYFVRATFWPVTPDILTDFMVKGGVTANRIRAILAATGSPSWGIYEPFETVENVQRDGFEEFNDNEKYEIKVRDFEKANKKYKLNVLLTQLNAIRHRNVALQNLHNAHRAYSSSDEIVTFTKKTGNNLVFTAVTLNCKKHIKSTVSLDYEKLGLKKDYEIEMIDELSGKTYTIKPGTKLNFSRRKVGYVFTAELPE